VNVCLECSAQRELGDDDPERQLLSDGITSGTFVVDTRSASHSQTGMGIDQCEWEIAQEADTFFQTFRTVMMQLESDRYGTIADVWRGILAIRQFMEEGPFSQAVFEWADALKVSQRWVAKCPTLPTDGQKATVISNVDCKPKEINRLSVPFS
jgi:hypothetical protein